jgi:hypothetical protein
MADFLGPYSWEQGQSKRWNPTSGEGLVRRWRGSQQMCESYFNSLQGTQGVLDLSMDQDGDGPIYIVTAVFGAIQDGVPETDASIPYFWELPGNMVERSIFSHPNFTEDGTLTDAEREAVRTAFEDKTGQGAGWSALQISLWGELTKGRETYMTPSFALRITRTFSSQYANTIPTTDVFKLYTYAQVEAEAASIASPISTAIDANIPSGGYWLKQPPVLRELSNRKLELNQEWWWDPNWSQVAYDLKT